MDWMLVWVPTIKFIWTNAPTAMHVCNTIQYICINSRSLVYRVRKETLFDKNIWCARIHNQPNSSPIKYFFYYHFRFEWHKANGKTDHRWRPVELKLVFIVIERENIESRVRLLLFSLFSLFISTYSCVLLFPLLSLFNTSFHCLTACNR